jgi:hypothetical protein
MGLIAVMFFGHPVVPEGRSYCELAIMDEKDRQMV